MAMQRWAVCLLLLGLSCQVLLVSGLASTTRLALMLENDGTLSLQSFRLLNGQLCSIFDPFRL